MRINDSAHLTYCTNIHPGSNWERTFSSLKAYVPLIKKEVANKQAFGLGLRLSNKASEELGLGPRLSEFKTWLQENDIYVFTMNGFPYGNFHDERVKDNVHAPDWTTKERLTYTRRLFTQLAELLPDAMDGGISTSPISYKHWHISQDAKHQAFTKGAAHLCEVVLQLHDIELRTGKYLHLDLEPEPDGLIENSDEFLFFFDTYLLPIAQEALVKELSISTEEIVALVKRHITMCYDICHFSLAYEEPESTFQKLSECGIGIGKIQVSAALKILYTEDEMEAIWESLARFDEPTYLHQVTEMIDGKVHTYNDLPIVLKERKVFTELRAHFHVPIFLEQFGKLYSTQDHILKVTEYLKGKTISNHLEIETYTWDVLPKELKKDLSDSIVREIEWLKKIVMFNA